MENSSYRTFNSSTQSPHHSTANFLMLIIVQLLIFTFTFQPLCVCAGSGRHLPPRNRLSAVLDKGRTFARIATVTVGNGTQINEKWSVSTEGPGDVEMDAEETDDGDAIDAPSDPSSTGQEDQVPPIPSSLRSKATATSIAVTWSPPKNSKIMIRGYTIGWGIGFPDVYSKVLDERQRSYNIKDLQPGSEYVISLRAYNNMGDGQPAYDTVRTLQEDLAESSPQLFPPVGLKATVLSSSSVVLQWTDTLLPSTRQPTDSRIYVVRYTSNFRLSSPKYKYANSTKMNILIDDLKPSTQYEFAVKVVKGRQESTWSMSVVNTTADTVPSSAPRDLTIVHDPEGNPSNVRLQWQPPKQPNGQVNGYVILYTTDESKNDRDWSIHPLMGDKMNAVLNNLLPDTNYYFKIQARNEKGTGPLSYAVSFRTHSITASSMMNIANKAISTRTLYAVIAGISAMTLVLLLVISLLLCRSKRPVLDSKTRKGGCSSTASCSPRSSNCKNKRESRELHPPDLWIHHEQLELKSMEKNHPRDDATPPVLRTFQESPVQLESSREEQRKGIVSYTSDSLYDDIDRTGNSSIDPDIKSSYSSATSTIKRTARAKPIMIPATSTTDGTLNSISCTNTPVELASTSTTVFEPSTGLSRPVYPRTYSYSYSAKPQLTFELNDSILAHHNLYDPVPGSSIQLPYPAPNLVSSNNVPSYSSYGNKSSCAMSPTDLSSLIPSSHATSSPSINNLTLRPLPGLQSLRTFTTLTETHTLPSNTPKHIAVKPQMNATLSNTSGTDSHGPVIANDMNGTSPLKKPNCDVYNHLNGHSISCDTKPVQHVVNPSFKEHLDT